MNVQEQIDDITPKVAADIDATVLTHPGAQSALGSGAIGSLIAGPAIRIVIARLLPVLKTKALSLVDAEVVKLKAQYPTVDLSFVHGLVESVFNAISGAGSPSPAVGTMGPVS